jgi:hypothetical protein
MLFPIASSLALLLTVEQWIVMLSLIFVPAIAAELTNLVLRRASHTPGGPPRGTNCRKALARLTGLDVIIARS